MTDFTRQDSKEASAHLIFTLVLSVSKPFAYLGPIVAELWFWGVW